MFSQENLYRKFSTPQVRFNMRMKSSPAELVVGSSQDLEDDLSDVEEVFIRDGKSGKCREIENKPLMPSRKKHQHKNSKTTQQLKILKKQYKRSRCSRCLEPFCYALLVLLIILILSAIVLTLFPVQKLKSMFQSASPKLYQALVENNVNTKFIVVEPTIEKVPCQSLGVKQVWSRTFAKLNSEAPVRKTDLDGDGVEDLIIGFGVDDSIEIENSNDIPQCTMTRGQMDLCEGGVMALNGVSGDVMWKFWASFAIFSLFCKFDVNDDRVNDCIVSGPGGLLAAVDGKSGRLLWQVKEFNMQTADEIDVNSVDLYTVNLIRDLDSDGVPDIIGAHTDERFGIREGHIRLVSGKTGKIIRSIPAPFKEEIFVPVQLISMKDGTEYLLVLTGGQNTAGGVYKIRLDSLKNFQNDNDYTTIQRSSSGFLVPAVITDLNGDLVDDFVVSSFNSTIYAFNGLTNAALWTFNFPSSETVSSIVPGQYNHDNVTDFLVKYSTGPGFPIYYYSQTTILNGINGESFLDNKVTDSGGPHSLLGGISVAQTFGGDFFFHFQSHCRDKYENAKDPYKFVPDSDIIQQSRADICMLRYNTSTVVKLNAMSRHVEPPGAVIFTSDDISLQLNQAETPKAVTSSNIRQPLKHPKMRIKQPQNRYQPQPPIEVNKKQSNMNEQHQQMEQQKTSSPEVIPKNRNQPAQVVVSDGQKQKALKFREKQLNREVEARREKMRENGAMPGPIMEGFEDVDNDGNFNDIMNKISMMDIPRQYKLNPDEILENPRLRSNNEQPDKSNDYEYYDTPTGQRYMQSMRRNWNQNNRGIRSGEEYEAPSNYESLVHKLEKAGENKIQDRSSQTVKKVLDDAELKKSSQPMVEPRPETLWDIEIEKENDENHKIRRRRSNQLVNQNILPSISSSGVLVESLNKTNSSIDFIFVLNVRESETFPPLLLPADVQCVEEKMTALGNYPQTNEMLEWQKNFLKDCLKNRLMNSQQPEPVPQNLAYETQITIIRLSITCTCNDINPGKEMCSTFRNVKDQKWTEFMGNQLDGTYSA